MNEHIRFHNDLLKIISTPKQSIVSAEELCTQDQEREA